MPPKTPEAQLSSPTSLAAIRNSFPITPISLLMAKGSEDEVETPSPGQQLSVAVPGRTISTLHLLSMLQHLGQDFAKSYNS